MNIKNYISGELRQEYRYKSFVPSMINHTFTWDDPQFNTLLEDATRVLGELNAFTMIVPNVDYSSTLSYNTFPFPNINEDQKKRIEMYVFDVLDEREKRPEKTLAKLYDHDKMPDGLRQAHHNLDIAIEQCYRTKPFASDEERLEHLFTLYEQMAAKGSN